MKANWRVETDWSIVSNGFNQGGATFTASPVAATNLSSFGNGELRVGLSGGFGAVDFGAINLHSLLGVHALVNPFGTAPGFGYGTLTRVNTAGNAVRFDNSLRYVTPSISGFTANVLRAQKQTKATGTTFGVTTNALGYYDFGGVQEIGFSYNNGPLGVAYSSLAVDNVGVGTNSATTPLNGAKTTLNSLGVAYTMGNLKMGLFNQTNKNSAVNSIDQKGTYLTATYTMGSTKIHFATGGTDNKVAYGSANTNGATVVGKSKMTSIGADYSLSKTTNLYFRNESITDNANLLGGYYSGTTSLFETASSSVGAKRTRTALGLKVSF